MTRWNRILIPSAACLLMITACQSEVEFVSASDNPHLSSASPGKPTASVDIRYRIVDEAIIGQPLSVEMQIVTATDSSAVRVDYRSADSSTLVVLREDSYDEPLDTRTVQVIPQVEGRSYFVVSVTVDTADGKTTRHTSIPVQVGTAGPQLETNGELLADEDGSLVISMPAKEN